MCVLLSIIITVKGLILLTYQFSVANMKGY